MAIYSGISGYNPKFFNEDGIDPWLPDEIGGPMFDPLFDLTDTQLKVLDFCRQLRDLDNVLRDSVQCWIEHFEEFVKAKDLEFPLSTIDFFT